MIEELDAQPEDGVVPLGGGLQVTVAQQRAALVNLFTLTMDFIEGFVNHTQGELRSHQAVLKEILEAAQNSESSCLVPSGRLAGRNCCWGCMALTVCVMCVCSLTPHTPRTKHKNTIHRVCERAGGDDQAPAPTLP